MFTLRLEWVRAGEKEHSMHQAMDYQVQRQGANDDRGMGARTVIALNPGSEDPVELVLDGHQVCYVMNEQGQTVDTIRNQKPKRRHT